MLQSGDTVVIIGGGIAGSAMARHLLDLCQRENRKLNIKLINSTSCNYCGGLVTNLALETFDQFFNFKIPEEQVLSKIESTIYLNTYSHTQITLPDPLVSTLRTSKFGITGFDDHIKDTITDNYPELEDCFEIIEPTIVKEVRPIEELGQRPKKWRILLSKKEFGLPIQIKAHVVVLATGLNALKKPMLSNFSKLTDYVPPPLMQASVTELDISNANFNNLQNKTFIIDGVIPNCVVSLICKGEKWVTITALNKKLTFDDINKIFSSPVVKEHIDLPNPVMNLRCGIVCGATVYTSKAKNFYGDDWVAIGDLTGCGRVLKDGYYAGLISAKLAAETLIFHGTKKKDFQLYYLKPLIKATASGNLTGMVLFNLNTNLSRYHWYNKLIANIGKREAQTHNNGGSFHTAIRALITGELSYNRIALLFFLSVLKYILFTPWYKIKNALS